MTKLITRKMPLTSPGPMTLDMEARQVQVILATENPVRVYDWDLGLVDEVLLMSGAVYPAQVPLLDTHDRGSVETVLGSASSMAVQGETLTGLVEFSTVARAQDALTKVQEGHLTDFSVGYSVEESVFVPQGQNQNIAGKTFAGPVKVATRWTVKELSICPLGADSQAKARMETSMNTDALQAERTRSAEIIALGEEFGLLDQAREAVTQGTTVADFQTAVLKSVRDNRNTQAPAFRIEAGATDDEKFRSAAEESLLLRGGMIKEQIQNPLAALSIRELARECLVRSGIRDFNGNWPLLMGRAFSSSDFPKILANVANKSLLTGYNAASETWMMWCETGSVNDFKTNSIVRPSEMSALQEVGQLEEYKHATRSEAQEQFSVLTYGSIFGLSRQSLINDDLGALTTTPQAQGETAARKVGDLAYSALTLNAAMGDSKALFHADHGNLAGTGGVPSITTIGAAVAAMKKQKDIKGEQTLNIQPQFFMAPVALEGSCEQIFLSVFEGTQAKPGLANPFTGNYFTRVYDPRLDNDSLTRWYIAGPKGKTVTVFFLNGVQAPYLESREGFNVDGIEYKVRIDCGAKAVDWRALYRNDGV